MASWTVGDWTVTTQTVDSVSSPKSIAVPDLDYADDFNVGGKPTLRQGDAIGVYQNVTSDSLVVAETIEYGVSDIPNVYTGTGVALSSQLAARSGRKATVKVRQLWYAVNSVSGQEVILPVESWTVFKVPTASIFTADMLEHVLKRQAAAQFATGSTDETLMKRLLRGDSTPA